MPIRLFTTPMRFAQPEYLYALTLIPVLAVFYAVAFRNKTRALARFGHQELLAKMMRTTSFRRQRVKAGLMVAAFACFIMALARPQLGTATEVVQREGMEIVIALDLSNSMLADDIRPNRLERAKHAIRRLMDRFQGDRVGLVVFAGAAFLQCPLTTDYGAVAMFLDGVDTQTIATQGTAIGEAVYASVKAFGERKSQRHKIVVLLTDGEDHESDPVRAARDAADLGVRIYTIGIGTPMGAPVPIKNPDGTVSGYKRTDEGGIVMSRLDEVTLEQIANVSNGKYYRSTLAENELDTIYDEISTLEKEAFESREFTRYEERYQIFLLLGLALVCLETLLTDRVNPDREWQGRFE